MVGQRWKRTVTLSTAIVLAALLLGLSLPATARPLSPEPLASSTAEALPVPPPEPPAPVSPTEDSSALPSPSSGIPPMPATVVVAPRTPDRVDRAWPKHPPWDACPRPVWPGERATGLPGGGRRVLVLGDSLTRESRTLTARGMRAAGWTPSFRCWGSRRLDWGIDQVARARQLRQLPKYVIVALGTNDISWETPATTERRVRALLDRLGPGREVIWVDLHLTRSTWLNARAAWFNALIRRFEAQRGNLTVVDWHRMARAKGIHGWDGIHYGPYGYRLRARTVLSALNAVGRADPPPIPTPIPTPSVPGEVAPSPAASSAPVLPSLLPGAAVTN